LLRCIKKATRFDVAPICPAFCCKLAADFVVLNGVDNSRPGKILQTLRRTGDASIHDGVGITEDFSCTLCRASIAMVVAKSGLSCQIVI
jgi:hypothetical protein